MIPTHKINSRTPEIFGQSQFITGSTVLQPRMGAMNPGVAASRQSAAIRGNRSEEHTSELQSRSDLVCRLLLEKKKKHTRADRHPRHPPATHSHPLPSRHTLTGR